MHIFILLSVLALANCNKKTDTPIQPAIIAQDLTGTYEGYKHFNKSTVDSIPVSLKLTKISESEMAIEEIKPFNHTMRIKLTGLNFVYNGGTGESQCGVIKTDGTGNFSGGKLYLLSTTRCVEGNGPDVFIEYRAIKK